MEGFYIMPEPKGITIFSSKSLVLSTDDVPQTFDCLSAFHRVLGGSLMEQHGQKTDLGPLQTVPKDKSFSACNKRTRRHRFLIAELVMNNLRTMVPGEFRRSINGPLLHNHSWAKLLAP